MRVMGLAQMSVNQEEGRAIKNNPDGAQRPGSDLEPDLSMSAPCGALLDSPHNL